MKRSKRYIALGLVLALVFLYKFQIADFTNCEVGQFRGGTLSANVWYPLVADDVNSQVLRVVIDNKEYTNEKYPFFMDDNRNIMVPVSILTEALNCSAHLYDGTNLLVEKHSNYALLTLDELLAENHEDLQEISSPLTKIDGQYYVSLNDLSALLGYRFTFEVKNNTFITADTAEDPNSLPPRYDLREKDRLSVIKDQGKLGTCWAFASLGALESSLRPEENLVFSVDHMSMSNSFNNTQMDGGEYTMSMAYLAAWQGPVYEADDPYGDGKSDNALKPVKHVQEMRIIPAKDLAAIKRYVFQYGGVQTSMYSSLKNANSTSKYYNEDTFSYCYIGTKKSNHDVVIIGWDDNYSKENFDMPLEGDGAFICQNSWGSEFGDDGVFYVSYYDSNIATHNVVYTRVDENDNYDNIYQSDLCGWVGKMGYDKESMYGANVYTAEKNENVVAASFYATGPDTEYKVFVVDNFTGKSSLHDRTLVASGTLKDAGYYTIDFEQEIPVAAGNRYAVVVYIKTPGATHPMAIEYDAGGKVLDNVDLEDGECYISYSGGTFINVKEKQDANLCIKAFTNNR